jgi:hypothetical protein
MIATRLGFHALHGISAFPELVEEKYLVIAAGHYFVVSLLQL